MVQGYPCRARGEPHTPTPSCRKAVYLSVRPSVAHKDDLASAVDTQQDIIATPRTRLRGTDVHIFTNTIASRHQTLPLDILPLPMTSLTYSAFTGTQKEKGNRVVSFYPRSYSDPYAL